VKEEDGTPVQGRAHFRNNQILISLKSIDPINTMFHEAFHWWFCLTGRDCYNETKVKMDHEELTELVGSYVSQMLNENGIGFAGEFLKEWTRKQRNEKNTKTQSRSVVGCKPKENTRKK